MRSDWVPVSASCLVIGAMSLVFGTVLMPAEPGASSSDMLRVATQDGARWLAMAVSYLLASLALTVGLPSILTLFGRRGRRTGVTAVALFAVGAIGTSGYAMLLVFFRALVVSDALRGGGAIEAVGSNPALLAFLQGWVACFYGGVLLLGVALVLARATPRWVPVVLVGFVLMLPFATALGRVGTTFQVLLLAIGFTGVAVAAVGGAQARVGLGRPAY